MAAGPRTTVDPGTAGDTIEVTFEFEPPLTTEKLTERLQPIIDHAEETNE